MFSKTSTQQAQPIDKSVSKDTERRSNSILKSFSFTKDWLLAPKAEYQESLQSQKNGSLLHTITAATKFMYQNCRSILIRNAAIGLTFAGFSLGVPIINGMFINAFAPGQSNSFAITAAVVGVVAFSFVNDLLARLGFLFSFGDYKKQIQIVSKKKHEVIRSWSFEETEDGQRRTLSDRFNNNASKIFEIVQDNISIGGALLSAGTASLLMLNVSWTLSACAVSFLLLRIYRDTIEAKISYLINKSVADAWRFTNVKEGMTTNPAALADIQYLEKDQKVHSDYQNEATQLNNKEVTNNYRIQFIRLTLDIIPATLLGANFALLGQSLINGSITTGSFVTMTGFAWNLLANCRNISAVMGAAMERQSYVSEALEFLSLEKPIDPNLIEIEHRDLPPEIIFKDVKVIRSGNTLLDIPCLVIKPGEAIGIVGKEGAGKSTLVKVIAKARELSEGTVIASWGNENYELKDIEKFSWISHLGVLGQNFYPISGLSIKYFNDLGMVDNAKVKLGLADSLRLAEAQEIIANKPAHEETVFGLGWGDNSSDFSGGEAKKLVIATVVRRMAPILILDEPTSNLPRESGAQVLRGICEEAKKYGLTVIIISHNFENFKFVDRIVSLESGKIVQDDHPDNLRNQPGLYRDGLLVSIKDNLKQLGFEIEEQGEDMRLRKV